MIQRAKDNLIFRFFYTFSFSDTLATIMDNGSSVASSLDSGSEIVREDLLAFLGSFEGVVVVSTFGLRG